jgi:hypothetical protein
MTYDDEGSGGGMQRCGCQLGRPCTCGMRQVKKVEPKVKEEPFFDEVELAPGVVMRLKKEYEYYDANSGHHLHVSY